MTDFVFIAVTVVFFAVGALYAGWCGKL